MKIVNNFHWIRLYSVTHKNKQTKQGKEKPRKEIHKRTWNTGKTLKQALQRNQMTYLRSSQQKCSMKKLVLRNFTKFTWKHLCQNLFFNKFAGLRPATLLKTSLAQMFHRKFCQISKNTSFTEHLWTTASVTCKANSSNMPNIFFAYQAHVFSDSCFWFNFL